ncbi:MAG: endonuclease/exonuclease/phosphatase family protein [Chitinophagales bacterium]|nr:endonuclease/exonuclease/phosphatase family protein [Bacteroidota bacterium]MCB9042610.1 endonuclease/exonuclease/phosphatase family protein [Chitinophagales bacterium]
MRKKSFFRPILLLLSILALAGLLMAEFAPFAQGEKYWFIALAGLAYPYLLLLNVLLMCYWLYHIKWYFLLHFLLIFFGRQSFKQTFALNAYAAERPSSLQKAIPLKIMSYNVRNFDLYNWKENKASREAMFDFIKKENPDILCLQEFYTEDGESADFQNIKAVINELGYTDYHFERTSTYKKTHHFGLATFSKLPIVGKNKLQLTQTERNLAIETIVAVAPNKEISIWNTHLQSLRFAPEDYEYIENIGTNTTLEGSKNIVRKLRIGFQKRSQQAERLRNALDNTTRPFIVCGDFNDTPNSYAYSHISASLQDAFLKAGGWGIGSTYNGPIPALRIDYILADSTFQVQNFERHLFYFSDHLPITADLMLGGK